MRNWPRPLPSSIYQPREGPKTVPIRPHVAGTVRLDVVKRRNATEWRYFGFLFESIPVIQKTWHQIRSNSTQNAALKRELSRILGPSARRPPLTRDTRKLTTRNFQPPTPPQLHKQTIQAKPSQKKGGKMLPNHQVPAALLRPIPPVVRHDALTPLGFLRLETAKPDSLPIEWTDGPTHLDGLSTLKGPCK